MTRHRNKWREARNGNYVCRRFLILVLENGVALLFRHSRGVAVGDVLADGDVVTCMRRAGEL